MEGGTTEKLLVSDAMHTLYMTDLSHTLKYMYILVFSLGVFQRAQCP